MSNSTEEELDPPVINPKKKKIVVEIKTRKRPFIRLYLEEWDEINDV
jgi:hypothetical protein